MFEKKSEPLAPFHVFRARVIRFLALAAAVTLAWLIIGGIGYTVFANLSWEDALYNSAMVVSDMGPVYPMTTGVAKSFESIYALISGLVFIAASGIALAPIIHRLFHNFHLENIQEE